MSSIVNFPFYVIYKQHICYLSISVITTIVIFMECQMKEETHTVRALIVALSYKEIFTKE